MKSIRNPYYLREKKRHLDLSNLSRHPITLIIIGFLFSGLIGTFLSNKISNMYKEADRERTTLAADLAEKARKKAERQEAVRELSKVIYARRTRAALLISAINRNNLDSARRRKIEYDQSYFEWNRDIQSNMLKIRLLSDSKGYSFYESVFQHGITGIFNPMDNCLTEAYDAFVDTETLGDTKKPQEIALNILKDCNIKVYMKASINCIYTYTEYLHEFVALEQRKESEEILKRNKLSQICWMRT